MTELPYRGVLLCLVAFLTVSTAHATEPLPDPVTDKTIVGTWEGITTGARGDSWVFRLQCSATGGGTLTIGDAYGNEPLYARLTFRTPSVVDGRVKIRATGEPPASYWRLVTLDLTGKSDGVEGPGMLTGKLVIFDDPDGKDRLFEHQVRLNKDAGRSSVVKELSIMLGGFERAARGGKHAVGAHPK